MSSIAPWIFGIGILALAIIISFAQSQQLELMFGHKICFDEDGYEVLQLETGYVFCSAKYKELLRGFVFKEHFSGVSCLKFEPHSRYMMSEVAFILMNPTDELIEFLERKVKIFRKKPRFLRL